MVQWYGLTIRGVAAENSFSNCNVKAGGNDGGGALGGVGECYHGSDPMFYTEYVALRVCGVCVCVRVCVCARAQCVCVCV